MINGKEDEPPGGRFDSARPQQPCDNSPSSYDGSPRTLRDYSTSLLCIEKGINPNGLRAVDWGKHTSSNAGVTGFASRPSAFPSFAAEKTLSDVPAKPSIDARTATSGSSGSSVVDCAQPTLVESSAPMDLQYFTQKIKSSSTVLKNDIPSDSCLRTTHPHTIDDAAEVPLGKLPSLSFVSKDNASMDKAHPARKALDFTTTAKVLNKAKSTIRLAYEMGRKVNSTSDMSKTIQHQPTIGRWDEIPMEEELQGKPYINHSDSSHFDFPSLSFAATVKGKSSELWRANKTYDNQGEGAPQAPTSILPQAGVEKEARASKGLSFGRPISCPRNVTLQQKTFTPAGYKPIKQNVELEQHQTGFSNTTVEEKDDEDEEPPLQAQNKLLFSEVEKHKRQLERLQKKDPEFFQYLKEHDKELLDFDDEEEEEVQSDDAKEVSLSLANGHEETVKQEASTSSLSTSVVEAWCKVIKEKQHLGTVCNLLRAYRTACHYGDGKEEEFTNNYNISSSHVFNKIMFFTLSEMDGVLKKLLGINLKETNELCAAELEKRPRWKKVKPLIKSYFGNTLHILNQMTDDQMIAFTLKRLKASTCFLGAFPRFAHKYLKVALHCWGRMEGSVSLISFLFIREMAIHMGTDFLDACLKGIYKEYAANSKFVSASAIPRIRFTANCVVELYGIDLAASYQHAFVFIRQLAVILRDGLTMKTKESFKNVYSWQYMNCLELWVETLCMYVSRKDLQPLTYPVAQIISGVAHLVPTARYFPLRLQCVRMLNKLSSATGSFIPVTALLIDMLHFKELNKPPIGGVGRSLDFGAVLKVSKPTLRTRAFQDECVATAIEQILEHLVQWSYAIAFPELALVPLTGLRKFMKETTIDRYRRQMKQLVNHIEQNVEYVGRKRDGVSFAPKDASLVSSFLQVEKNAGSSPLSQFAVSLRQRSEQRRAALHTSSILVREEPPKHSKESLVSEVLEANDCDEANIFSSDWLPSKKHKRVVPGQGAGPGSLEEAGLAEIEADSEAEDIIEDFELSSDADETMNDLIMNGKEDVKQTYSKKRKTSKGTLNNKKRLQERMPNSKVEEQRENQSRQARMKGKPAYKRRKEFQKKRT